MEIGWCTGGIIATPFAPPLTPNSNSDSGTNSDDEPTRTTIYSAELACAALLLDKQLVSYPEKSLARRPYGVRFLFLCTLFCVSTFSRFWGGKKDYSATSITPSYIPPGILSLTNLTIILTTQAIIINFTPTHVRFLEAVVNDPFEPSFSMALHYHRPYNPLPPGPNITSSAVDEWRDVLRWCLFLQKIPSHVLAECPYEPCWFPPGLTPLRLPKKTLKKSAGEDVSSSTSAEAVADEP